MPGRPARGRTGRQVRHVIGVLSGKGGVGKSLISGMLATAMARRGYRVGVLDADLTGPTIPTMFDIGNGLKSERSGMGGGMWSPALSDGGIQIISVNCLLDDPTDPVLWGGNTLIAMLKRFWVGVLWNDVDFLFVDMPPGTGDVAMTVFESFPLDGVVIVASPQKLVGVMAEKSLKMAKRMDVPVLGMVQNMSYFVCPHCSERHYVFGHEGVSDMAVRYGVSLVVELPFDNAVATLADQGRIELADVSCLDRMADALATLVQDK